MKIIAHRGFWLKPGEKNTVPAFQRSIDNGFGIETDIRDYRGELVISHDVPTGTEELLSFHSFLEMYRQNRDKNAVLAINIKSDGLTDLLQEAIKKHNLSAYFAFDMSFPGMFFGYKNSKVNFFTSVNEYHQKPVLLNKASGIWLDAYEDIWYNMALVRNYLEQDKNVCIVSPELHNRNYQDLWREIRDADLYRDDRLSLCTDYPGDAERFFC